MSIDNAAGGGQFPSESDAQITVKFITKISAEFRVPGTPVVSFPGQLNLFCILLAMHADSMPLQ